MKNSTRLLQRPFRHNLLKCGQILVFLLLVFSGTMAFGQTTIANGDWESTAVWPAGNHPTFNLPRNPDVVVNHNVRVHTQDLLLGDDNDGHLIINGRLEIVTQLRVTKNQWFITVAPGAQLIVAGGVRFEQPAGSGQGLPDLIINGVARINGSITGVGVISGNGTLIANSIGPGVTYATGTGGWTGTVHVTPDPLPIELLSFSVDAGMESVLLNWETATETNNDFFTIERSTDVRNWEILGYVDGAGNSNRPLSYSFTDNRPLEGISYYRLKQTDYDGQFEYFGPVATQFNLSQHSLSFRVFRQSDQWVIVLPGEGLHHVEVYNLQGLRLLSQPAEHSLSIPVQRGPVVIRVVDQNSRSASQVVQ